MGDGQPGYDLPQPHFGPQEPPDHPWIHKGPMLEFFDLAVKAADAGRLPTIFDDFHPMDDPFCCASKNCPPRTRMECDKIFPCADWREYLADLEVKQQDARDEREQRRRPL